MELHLLGKQEGLNNIILKRILFSDRSRVDGPLTEDEDTHARQTGKPLDTSRKHV